MADNVNPIIYASVVDTNDKTIDLTGNPEILIRYFSDAKATMVAEAQNGATIDESLYIIRNGDRTAYGTEYTFTNVESNEFSFSAEDNNRNIGTAHLTPEMVNYTKVTCKAVQNKPDALGNMTVACSGSFFNGSFGKESNTITAQYRYKAFSDYEYSDYFDMSVTKIGNSYYASANLTIPDFDYKDYYRFEIIVFDVFEYAVNAIYTVTSSPLFHWGENDFTFEVPVIVKNDQTIKGNLRLKGDGNYGNKLLFGDSEYCYISEPEDDVMLIKANKIRLQAVNGVSVGDFDLPKITKSDTWLPYLNSNAISSYTAQKGWYTKINNCVTVGFYIKATCNAESSASVVYIGGLPFTPMYAASGGGICSGVRVSAGYNFLCFVAETTGEISTRVQSCNHTTSGNLSTSASGCLYRSDVGEITLSGTITYMTNS